MIYTLVSQIELVADSLEIARMHLKAWTVGMRAKTKHGAGTPAAVDSCRLLE